MPHNLTQAIEDYLKTIYECTRDGERASTTQLSEKLGVTPASVTGMLQKLTTTHPPLVDYQKHRGVLLTPPGEKVALEVVRHHRLLEMFLHQVLGYEWDEVHAEADRLEHVISEEFEARIAATLGHPQHDPHGDPIPSLELEMPASSSLTLYQLRPPQSAIVRRVSSSDSELLRYLGELGVVPQAEFTLLAYSSFDENLTLQVSGKPAPVVLGPQITRVIFVETLPHP
jgi:DtxR family transcriptional regulator, Mn-dependent transcriptional regulator